MMVGAATVFVVRDLTASLAHYRDALGFAVSFEYGEPTFYACLCRDEVQLVDNVDALHADLVGRGAKVLKPPQDYAYGMRDFDVIDPDGNQLTFGQAV